MGTITDAFICGYVRTPIGRYGGALSSVRADDLGAVPIRVLMARHDAVDWGTVDDVVYGCANQAGEDNRNVARMAVLLAGLPEAPGFVALADQDDVWHVDKIARMLGEFARRPGLLMLHGDARLVDADGQLVGIITQSDMVARSPGNCGSSPASRSRISVRSSCSVGSAAFGSMPLRSFCCSSSLFIGATMRK